MSMRIPCTPLYSSPEVYDHLTTAAEDNEIYSYSWDDDVVKVHIKQTRYFYPGSRGYITLLTTDSEDVAVC